MEAVPEDLQALYSDFPIRVVREEGKGRFLVASRELRKGETVMMAHPYAWALLPDQKASNCRFCLGSFAALSRKRTLLLQIEKEDRRDGHQRGGEGEKEEEFEDEIIEEKRFPCPNCNDAFYCSKKCLKADSMLHGLSGECKILQNWNVASYDPELVAEMELALRVLSRRTVEILLHV